MLPLGTIAPGYKFQSLSYSPGLIMKYFLERWLTFALLFCTSHDHFSILFYYFLIYTTSTNSLLQLFLM